MREELPTELLTSDEVVALLRTFSRRAPTSIRNRALVTVLYRAGLRLAEALALEIRDLDLDAGTLNIRRGKGGKRRLAAMDDGAWGVLQAWLQVRERIIPREHRTVFCTLDGGQLNQSYVRAMIGRKAAQAGIEKRVHAHGFRHLFAVELVREGVNLPCIQRLLGHRSLATTAVYLDRMSPQESIDAIRNRPGPGFDLCGRPSPRARRHHDRQA